MAIASLEVTGIAFMSATPVSQSIAIPETGTPTVALVTNISDEVAFVALGDDTVEATQYESVAVLPRSPVALTIGAATNIAAVTLNGVAGLNIAFGT